MTGKSRLGIDGLDDRLAIVGTSGAGKTYAARGLVEILVRSGARVCAVDPLGVWWGLRAGREGAAKGGLPMLILGGAHADVPITEDLGAAIGRVVGSTDIQCVLDVSGLPSKAARQRFMRAFFETLYETNVQPLHLVLDEADLWAPQRPMPDQTVLQGQVGEIVRRGRVRGFVPWLITQRPAVLDKDVLSQADTLIAFKLTSSQDRAAIGGWIEGQADRADEKRVLADLPRLPRGEAYVWAPGRGLLERMKFPAITTYDSSSTPERGAARSGPALAPVDVAAITAALRATPTVAVRTLPALKADERLLAAAREEGRRAALAEFQTELLALRHQVAVLSGTVEQAANLLLGVLLPNDGVPRPPVSRPSEVAAPPAAKKSGTAPAGGLTLHPAARAILAVLAPRVPAALTWRQVATLAGLAPQGGHWNAGRKQLRDLGFTAEQDGKVAATDSGVASAGDLLSAPSGAAAVRALWCSKLPTPALEMLRALADAGLALTPAELSERLGKKPHGGHWNAGMKSLRDNGLVEITPAGLRLVPELLDGAP